MPGWWALQLEKERDVQTFYLDLAMCYGDMKKAMEKKSQVLPGSGYIFEINSARKEKGKVYQNATTLNSVAGDIANVIVVAKSSIDFILSGRYV